MGNTYSIKIIDSQNDDYACGNCYSIMLGDEDICPVCSFIVDVDDVIVMNLRLLQYMKDAKNEVLSHGG